MGTPDEALAPVATSLVVDWDGERRFSGGAPNGPTLTIDCARHAAPGPVDTVVLALASCAAVDVLEILAKRRTPATSLRVESAHTRADGVPRRLTGVHLRFIVATTSPARHVERAVELATTRYCSVARSLDPGLPITTEVVVTEPAADGGAHA